MACLIATQTLSIASSRVALYVTGRPLPELSIATIDPGAEGYEISREPAFDSPVRLMGSGPHRWTDASATPGGFYSYKASRVPADAVVGCYPSPTVSIRVSCEAAFSGAFLVYSQAESGRAHIVEGLLESNSTPGHVNTRQKSKTSFICRAAGGEEIIEFELGVLNGRKFFTQLPQAKADSSAELFILAAGASRHTALARFEWNESMQYQGFVKRWPKGPKTASGTPMVALKLTGNGSEVSAKSGTHTGVLEAWHKTRCQRVLHQRLTDKIASSKAVALNEAAKAISEYLFAQGYREELVRDTKNELDRQSPPITPNSAIYRVQHTENLSVQRDSPRFNLPAAKPGIYHGPPPGKETRVTKTTGYGTVLPDGSVYIALRSSVFPYKELTIPSLSVQGSLTWETTRGVQTALSQGPQSTYYFGPVSSAVQTWHFDRFAPVNFPEGFDAVYRLSRETEMSEHFFAQAPIASLAISDVGAVAVGSIRTRLRLTLDTKQTKLALVELFDLEQTKARCRVLAGHKPF